MAGEEFVHLFKSLTNKKYRKKHDAWYEREVAPEIKRINRRVKASKKKAGFEGYF